MDRVWFSSYDLSAWHAPNVHKLTDTMHYKSAWPLHPFAHDPVFHWHKIPPPQLWINGEQFFPALLSALQNAQHSIWIEIYLVQSGLLLEQFKQVWIDAVRRGVQVCICCDSLGSQNFRKSDRSELIAAGVDLVFYNPVHWRHPFRSLLRDHRKIILIDQQQVFVGGAGISDDFSHENSQNPWRETMLSLEGHIVNDWKQLFAYVWRQYRPEFNPDFAKNAPTFDQKAVVAARVNRSDVLHPHGISTPLLRAMRLTEQRIWIATPYFIPPRRIRQALRQAAKRRVDVRLLIPGEHSDQPWLRLFSRTFYPGLLRAGVKIHEYQPSFLHMKVMLCDHWVSMGSCNLDRWGMFWNLEANQELRDAPTAEKIRSMLENDFSFSNPVAPLTMNSWLSLLRRILQTAIVVMERFRPRH